MKKAFGLLRKILEDDSLLLMKSETVISGEGGG